jgi:hypothetical protein
VHTIWTISPTLKLRCTLWKHISNLLSGQICMDSKHQLQQVELDYACIKASTPVQWAFEFVSKIRKKLQALWWLWRQWGGRKKKKRIASAWRHSLYARLISFLNSTLRSIHWIFEHWGEAGHVLAMVKMHHTLDLWTRWPSTHMKSTRGFTLPHLRQKELNIVWRENF